MNSLLLYFVCVLLIIFIIFKQRKCWYFIWQLNGWHGLVQQPILWLLLIIYLDPKSIMTNLQRCSKYFQLPLAIIVFNRILLCVDDPETIENVLNAPECLNKTFLQDAFYANKGLLHAKDEQWKIRRKQLNPAFSQNTLLSFFGVFNDAANEMKFKIGKDMQGYKVNFKDLEDLIARTVLQVSCITTMGFATNFTQNDEKCIAKSYRYLMEMTALRLLKPWYQIDFIFRMLDKENYEKSKKANKLVEEFVANIVQQKHTEWQEKLHNAKNVKNSPGISGTTPKNENNDKVSASSSLLNEHLKSHKVTTATTTPTPITANDALQNMDMESVPDTDAFMHQQQRLFIDQIFYLAQTGKMTLQDIMNESQSMVVVSFETVSTCIINALLCLAINRECQMKLRHEIEQILSKNRKTTSIKYNSNDTKVTNVANDDDDDEDGDVVNDSNTSNCTKTDGNDDDVDVDDVTMEHLQSMPYLDMIINESLRLLTTVPMNLRNVSSDFQLNIIQQQQRDKATSNNSKSDSNNRCCKRRLVVPKDTMIALDTFNMQRNEKYWGENALKFYPEHFSKNPEQQQQQKLHHETNTISSTTSTTSSAAAAATSRHSYAFIPFSKGLRTCIGYRYSIYVSKIILIKLISSFKFATDFQLKDLQYYEGISLKFRNAENINFQIHSSG